MFDLKNKIAVVFAATGEIAAAVATSFSKHGAKVYLSARNLDALGRLAVQIREDDGWAEAETLDAMDEIAIENYLKKVVEVEGRLDIIFNGIGIVPSESSYGSRTTDLSFEHFMKPITTHVGSQFLTSRIAARYMMQTNSHGTILTLTASLSRLKLPFMAGITAACAAIEGLTRVMAAEFGQAGIKVICLNPTSLTETRTIRETTEASAKSLGIPSEVFQGMLAQQYLLKKSPTLADIGETAAFLVSDAGAVFNSHIMDVDFGSVSVI